MDQIEARELESSLQGLPKFPKKVVELEGCYVVVTKNLLNLEDLHRPVGPAPRGLTAALGAHEERRQRYVW